MKILKLLLSLVFCLACGGVFASGEKVQDEPITIAVIHFSRPISSDMDFSLTAEYLRKKFAPTKVIVKELSSPELEKAIKEGTIDFFYASSGFFWRMHSYGVHPIATIVTTQKPNPNEGTAAAFLTNKDRDDLKSIEDLRGKKVGANYASAFHGHRVGLGEIADRGHDPDKFFGEEYFVGEDARKLLDVILNREVDAIMLRACWLEEFELNNIHVMQNLKILSPRSGRLQCLHSTRSYPNNIIGATFKVKPELAKEMTVALLSMPESARGQTWSISTDLQPLDTLHKNIRQGPYEYLRHWNLRRVIRDYWPILVILLVIIVGLYLHSLRAQSLVERRTRQLLMTQREKEKFKHKAADLTERMEAHQKMNLIGQLSSMFAHEMNQPLAACSCFIEGLQELIKRQGSVDKNTLEFGLSQMGHEIELASSIVQRVRSYAKQSASREDKVDLSQIISETAQALSLKFEGKVRQEIDIENNVLIQGDQLEIRLLCWNLLKNAMEAAVDSADPQVDVYVKKTEDAKAVLTVKNTGQILSEEEFENIGKKMFASTKKTGLGIGLTVVNSIVEANLATLERIRNSEGGLTVKVTFAMWKENE